MSAHALYGTTTGRDSYGVYAKTTGQDIHGVYGSTTNNGAIALYGYATGTNTYAVYGRTTNLGSDAIYAVAEGDYSNGVTGHSSKSYGVAGYGQGGVFAIGNTASAIYADTYREDHMYGDLTSDYMKAARYDTGSSDVAEYMPVSGDLAPGTVVIIGNDGRLQKSVGAYDTKVAGIISTDPGVTLGIKEAGNPGEAQIAIADRVPCKVDATKAPIHAGDLLTTSDTPGHAMKAEPDIVNGHKYYPDGTVLGKAMSSLESGTGTIEVLVTLQ